MERVYSYLILNNKKYFSIAEEYIELERIFKKETLFEKASLWVDMVIHPIIAFVTLILRKQNLDIFSVLTIQKTIRIWTDWFRYLTLGYETREWIDIVRSVGGPFISTNDPTYHMYVYADGMQRLQNQLHMKPL